MLLSTLQPERLPLSNPPFETRLVRQGCEADEVVDVEMVVSDEVVELSETTKLVVVLISTVVDEVEIPDAEVVVAEKLLDEEDVGEDVDASEVVDNPDEVGR